MSCFVCAFFFPTIDLCSQLHPNLSCSFSANQTDDEDGDGNGPDGDAGRIFVRTTGPDGRATLSDTNPNRGDSGGLFVDGVTGQRVDNDPGPNRPSDDIFIATGPDGRAMQVGTNPNNVGDETAVGGFTVSFSLVGSVPAASSTFKFNLTRVFFRSLVLPFLFFLRVPTSRTTRSTGGSTNA